MAETYATMQTLIQDKLEDSGASVFSAGKLDKGMAEGLLLPVNTGVSIRTSVNITTKGNFTVVYHLE